MSEKTSMLAVGCVIAYRLHENQIPIHRWKVWRGKVLKVTINQPGLLDSVIVQSLEEGYEKTTDFVLLGQIVAIEQQDEPV